MENTVNFCITDDPVIRHLQIVELVLFHCTDILWPSIHANRSQASIWLQKLRHRIKNFMVAKSVDSLTHIDTIESGGLLDKGSSVPKPPATTDSLDSLQSSRHQKSGCNGLHVASADVILLKTPYPREERVLELHTLLHPSHVESKGAGKPPVEVDATSDEPPKGRAAMPGVEARPQGLCGDRALLPNFSREPSQPAQTPSGAGEGRYNASSTRHTESDDESELSISMQKRYRGATPAMTLGGEVVLVTATGHSLHEDDDSLLFLDLPLQVQRLSGGITNELFRVFDPENPSKSVVVRIFGKETERVISRESELFYQSLFLKTFVHGDNFLIYEFLNSFETLPYAEMPIEGEAIAKAIAAFQVRATWAARRGYHSPLPANRITTNKFQSSEGVLSVEPATSAQNGWEGTVGNSCAPRSGTGKSQKFLNRFERESNYTIHSLTAWVGLIVSEEIVHKVNEEKQNEFRRVGKELHEESQYMLKLLELNVESLGEGVCHNDLLSANFMRHVDTRELKIIDFDYTKRNFLLFDLANHFNEYTGLECDYATYFPSDKHITTFVRNYRRAMRSQLERTHAELDIVEDIIPNERVLFFSESVAQEEEAVVKWTRLVKFLTLYSHLSWSVWSLLQEAVSALDVDFLEYGKLRLARYHETRDIFSRPCSVNGTEKANKIVKNTF